MVAVGRPFLLLLFLAASAAATRATAQTPTTRRLSFGARITANRFEAGDADWAPGGAASVGYGLSRVVVLIATADRAAFRMGGASGASWSLWGLGLGVRLRVPSTSSGWTPYLGAGMTHHSGSLEGIAPPLAGSPGRRDVSGNALSVSAGGLVPLSGSLAVDVRGTMTWGPLPNPADDDPFETSWFAFGAGLSWCP